MLQRFRPAGRLFYWVLAVLVTAASARAQSGPALTSVIDAVYLAGGSPAQGILIRTWPSFWRRMEQRSRRERRM
jgi:hypothetical protein